MKGITLKYISAVLMLLILHSPSNAQSIGFKKDTVYLFYCYGTLENGRPVANSFVCKNLNFFRKLIEIKSEDEFLCSLFKNSVVYVDAFISMYKHESQYNFSNKGESAAFYKKFSQQNLNLNKSSKDFISKVFSNKKKLILSISKLAGEFWMDKIKPDYIYPLSGKLCGQSQLLQL